MKTNLLVLLLVPALLAGCATKVERVDVEKKVDLSGGWNDYDAMLVSQEFIESALSGHWLETFSQEYGREPILIVGYVANNSSEHINTQVIVKYLERELMNSGKVIFVASSEEREGVREEREDMQAGYTDPETIKAMGKEKGADLMFIGSINAVKDQEKNKYAVLYQVNMELVDLMTNVKIWFGQKDIKKVVTKPRLSL
ncbi:MAG TPA: penicillin-binding protein activator LpoB [Candidatus Omnitrophota bacterium]|nr:penicillin-binding protein activator LpoB [Candidatus Omnitrophota bacterium]